MKNAVTFLCGAMACLALGCLPALAGATAPSPVPEPSTVLLVAGAGAALVVIRQLRKKK